MRALASIEDFNEAFDTHFSDEEVDTIGGLVMQAFGHLPARGESIDIDGYQFKVAMADSRRIIQVHVKLPDDAPPAEAGRVSGSAEMASRETASHTRL